MTGFAIMTAAEPAFPRIMIVDDDPIVIRTLAQILDGMGEITFAKTGEAAIRKILEGRIDLVLLDAELPGLSGFDVCAQLKQSPETNGIPIIFVTSHADAGRETRALDLGAIDFISKPVSAPVVRARVATHLTLRRQTELLTRLAMQDGLTGIANRRRFEATIDAEWRRAQRTGRPLTLMMIDVDHFKAYNDRYGHPAGDACLREAAKALEGSVRRASDLIARYGGEEFAILLCDSAESGAGALHVADAIHQAMRDAGMPHDASPTAAWVTASIGVATTYPAAGQRPEALIRAADRALYRAKALGRNQTSVAAAVEDVTG